MSLISFSFYKSPSAITIVTGTNLCAQETLSKLCSNSSPSRSLVFSEVKGIVLGKGSFFLVRIDHVFGWNFFQFDDFAVMRGSTARDDTRHDEQHPRCKS